MKQAGSLSADSAQCEWSWDFGGGDASNLLPIDAIQEFSTEQNPKAEFGWRDGSVINVAVKAGTNSLHGTAYAFGRDTSATDAANPFTHTVTAATLEQFGAPAGGRVIKNKVFWFAAYEDLRVNVADVSVVTIPSDIALPTPLGVTDPANQLSMVNACKVLGPVKINPLSAQLAGLNPTTCVVTRASATFENLFPFNASASNSFAPGLPNTAPLNNGLFKGDWDISQHHHLTGMYYVSKSTAISTSGQSASHMEQPDYQQHPDVRWKLDLDSEFHMGEYGNARIFIRC